MSVKLRAATAFVAALAAATCLAGPAAAGDFAGVYADDAFFGSPAYRSIAFGAQAGVGVEIVRQPFDWRRIETSAGHYEFADYDDFVLRAAAAGLRVLPVLGNPPPFRALTLTSDELWSPPLSNAAFGVFAAKLVERYGPGGTLWTSHPSVTPLPIRSWQVWNEPNLVMFWNTGPNAAQYTALLKAAYAAIHAADPSAEVVAAGLPNSSMGVPLENFLGGMFAAGAHGAFDTMAVHAYAPTPADAVGLISFTRSLLTAYGDSSPVWVTEVGWSTGGPLSSLTVSEAGQAAYIADVIRRLGTRRDALGVRGVVVFRWRDALSTFDAWPLHAGMLRADATAKPSLAAFRDAVAALKPAPTGTTAEGGATPAASDASAPDGEPAAPSSAPAHARVAISGGELSRFGFLRVHLKCLESACSGRLRAGRAAGACSGSRRFAFGAREAAVVRISLRRARRGVTRCKRILVTAETGSADPQAAAFLPDKARTVTLRP